MNEILEINCGSAVIRATIPMKAVLDMEISTQENEHSSLWIKAIVPKECQEDIMTNSYFGEDIRIYDSEDKAIYFRGRVERLDCHKEEQYMQVDILAYGGSMEFDRKRKKRSFQDVTLTYRQVIERPILDMKNVFFQWNMGTDKRIDHPLIQYEETDWEFFKRLASHFNSVIYGDAVSGKSGFSFGMKMGKQLNMEDMEILSSGFSNCYYTEGGYENGLSRSGMCYMETESVGLCRIGDYIMQEGKKYTAYRSKIKLVRGKICFFQTLGTAGMYRRKRTWNESLCGLRLKGTVRKTELESVFLQLDIDKEEGAAYAWPWVPETGNLCYQMPETKTKAVLYLPTCEEKDGLSIHMIRTDSDSGKYNHVQNREYRSKHSKKWNLHPDNILLGTDSSSISLSDSNGISLDSESKISFSAARGISINGQKITVEAPLEIVCRVGMSNIEISRDFNFYAPAGVKTQGKNGEMQKNSVNVPIVEEETVEYWQSSYTAMAAIPSFDIAKGGGDSVVDLMACGTVAKMAKGSTTVAMSEVMSGKKEKNTKFPQAFRSMESYTVKGGYLIPEAGN